MAAIDHRRGAGMQADSISEIFRSFSNVLFLAQEFIDIPAARAEQPNNISRSVVRRTVIDGESSIFTSWLVPLCFQPANEGLWIRGVLWAGKSFHLFVQELKLLLH